MFKNTKKILKGLGKAALGVGAIVSVAMVAYGAANAHISNEATQVANMTAGNKQATIKIVKENSPLAVKYSNLVSPAMDKIFGAKGSISASDYFINKACDTTLEKFKKGAIEYETASKLTKSKSTNSLEEYISTQIDNMRSFQKNVLNNSDLVSFVESNTDKKKLVNEFMSDYKSQKVDNNKVIEKGIKNGQILSFDNFSQKLSQPYSVDETKEKYGEYLKSEIKTLATNSDKKIAQNIEIDYNQSNNMSI